MSICLCILNFVIINIDVMIFRNKCLACWPQPHYWLASMHDINLWLWTWLSKWKQTVYSKPVRASVWYSDDSDQHVHWYIPLILQQSTKCRIHLDCNYTVFATGSDVRCVRQFNSDCSGFCKVLQYLSKVLCVVRAEDVTEINRRVLQITFLMIKSRILQMCWKQ